MPPLLLLSFGAFKKSLPHYKNLLTAYHFKWNRYPYSAYLVVVYAFLQKKGILNYKIFLSSFLSCNRKKSVVIYIYI